jgi:hypothetical protein
MKLLDMKSRFQIGLTILFLIGFFFISHSNSSFAGNENKVELLSHQLKFDQNSSKFTGEVQNKINQNVEYVTIFATFYDDKGDMIGSKTTYSNPNHIKSNMTAPFEIILENDLASHITSYDVTITWRYPGQSEKNSNVYG